MRNSNINIVVYGASNDNIAQIYKDEAYELGVLLAQKGWGCINGAGKCGLMRAVSDGELNNSGYVIGIIPQFMVDANLQYDKLSELIITPDMHTRKNTMAQRSSGAVALPGGCGTFEELLEIITWRQLGIYKHEVIILNTNHYYDDLIKMLEKSDAEGFMRISTSGHLWRIANSPAEVINFLEKSVETE